MTPARGRAITRGMTSSASSRVALLVLVVACACGPKHKPDNGGGGGGAGTGSGSSQVAADAPLTEAECTSMIHHMIDVTNEEKYKDAPDQKPLPEQVDKVKAEAVTAGKADCMKSFDRTTFDCVIAATTVNALTACAK
jgi:hypothetical protein